MTVRVIEPQGTSEFIAKLRTENKELRRKLRLATDMLTAKNEALDRWQPIVTAAYEFNELEVYGGMPTGTFSAAVKNLRRACDDAGRVK